jgi:hypothetical protein
MDISAYAADLAALYDKTALLFEKRKVPSDYIGDTYAWQLVGSVQCSALPVTDKLTVELYGPRVEHMVQLHAAPDVTLTDGMGVALTASAEKPEYKVISVKHRQTHTYALLEAIGDGSQSGGA